MTIVTKAPVRPTPVVNVGAANNVAEAARAEAMKMLEGAVIDDSKAPTEVGDKPAPKAVVEPEAAEEPSAEEKPAEEPVAEEEKPATEEKPKEEKKEGLPDPLKRSFEALAQEKKALRLEKEAVKAEKAGLAKYQLLDRAIQNGDVMSLIAAGGFKYQDVVAAVTGGKLPAGTADEEDAPAPGNEENSPLALKVKALEETIQKQNFSRGMEQLHATMVKAVDPKKYPNIAADPDLVQAAQDELVAFTRKTGAPPGENISESINMALEAIETREAAVVAKWKKRLGVDSAAPASDAGAVEPKSAVRPASELGKQSRTLTNSHASVPAKPPGSPVETVEELRAKALKLIPD